ncbi:MAG: TetR/AcrR family transcriptional regulator [Chitinophagales bacterium]
MKLKSAAKEEEIYRVVLEITAEAGLSGLKMANIAKQAGLAHGTVYIYFKNKKDLINQLYKKAKKSASQSILSKELANDNFMGDLRLLWKRYISYLLHHQKEIYFMQQCLNSPFLEDDSLKLSDIFLQEVILFFEKGQKERYVKSMEIQLILAAFKGIAREIVDKLKDNTLSLSDQLLEDSFELCWNAIRR